MKPPPRELANRGATGKPDWLTQQGSALLTDLYQLTMLQGYFDLQMEETAVFEFFVRRLPKERNFLVAAGLEQVLGYLESLAFSSDELDWLARSGRFSPAFIEYLANLRFTGDVYAMPEGTVFFENEPIVRVTAPLPQAQLIETRLINLLHFQTTIASKAARCVLAAPDKLLVDFGMRRSHGAEAALMAARASYLAGFTGTATVLANRLFDIPIFGTMAHSFIQAHDTEEEAFENFARSHPTNTVLLIDTYDTEQAARKVTHLARRLEKDGIRINAVRIDSGDLGAYAHLVRDILDDAGCNDIGVFCSGDLDEYKLQQMLADAAPVDGFGVGTHLDVSLDAPSIDCVYKLQEYAGRPRRKRSRGKATWPGRKQVFRRFDERGAFEEDLLTLEGDESNGIALIEPVMRGGERLEPHSTLADIRQHAKDQLAILPERLKRLEPGQPYRVTVSEKLLRLADAVDHDFR